MPKTPSAEVQQKAVAHIQATFSHFSDLLTWYRSKWMEMFRATYVFETDRKGRGKSQIFFPKCYEQVEKVHARITGNNPKFVLNLQSPVNPNSPEMDMVATTRFNQMALNYFWRIGNCQEKFEDWAKQGLIYNIGWAKVGFDQKTIVNKKTETKTNRRGEIIEREVETEEIINEYPTFEIPDIFDVYFDPRVRSVDDMMAIIENKDQVRRKDIMGRKDLYFNLDQFASHASGEFSSDGDNYKMNKFSEQGVAYITDNKLDEYVNIKDFYGYFSLTESNEDAEIYHMTVVDNSILIRMEKVDFIPFEPFSPTSIPNQTVGKGIVEPVKALQDAYNLTRNQRFENVSLVMNRMWLIKHGTGIDPRRLQSVAGNIIFTKDMDGIQPVDTRDVTSSSFSEADALNSEIQSTLGTIDASQDSGSTSFTNTATGEKIRWSEYNARFRAIKRNLERSLGKLGEKMLMMTAKRATQNPLIEDAATKQFFEVAKEAFNTVGDLFNVAVVADSTSFDTIENKRDNHLAWLQLAVTMQSQGVPIDMGKLFKDTAEEFGKNPDDYLMEQPTEQQGSQGGSIPQSIVEQAQTPVAPDQELNNQLTNV